MIFEALLTIPSHPAKLKEVRHWLIEPAQQANLTEEDLADVQLATMEACANIIEHAYEGRFDQPIALAVAANDGELKLTIRNGGKPFSLDEYQPPTVNQHIDSGYGIYLMQQAMDTVSFNRSATGETVLTMVKYRGQRKPATHGTKRKGRR
jgi:serine/threonine-protein kinase RsbW